MARIFIYVLVGIMASLFLLGGESHFWNCRFGSICVVGGGQLAQTAGMKALPTGLIHPGDARGVTCSSQVLFKSVRPTKKSL